MLTKVVVKVPAVIAILSHTCHHEDQGTVKRCEKKGEALAVLKPALLASLAPPWALLGPAADKFVFRPT